MRCSWLAALVLICSVPSASSGQPTNAEAKPGDNGQSAAELAKQSRAKALFEEGNAKYTLAKWQEAIELFAEAYEIYPKPSLLFNIAQAHRQAKNCERAIWFYKRFLDQKPDAANRTEVETFISKLGNDCPKPKPAVAPVIPPATKPSQRPDLITSAEPEPKPVSSSVSTAKQVQTASPKEPLIETRLALGGSYANLGDLNSPWMLHGDLAVSVPITLGRDRLSVGALVAFTPVPWSSNDGGMEVKGTMSMTSLVANLGYSLAVGGSWWLRGDIGAGGLFLFGITDEGNPFIAENKKATETIVLLHMRSAISLAYSVSSRAKFYVEPVLSFSPSDRDKLRAKIDSFSRFDVLAGVELSL